MNSDCFPLICYLFVNHFLIFVNNFQSLNFVDEVRLSLWGLSFGLLFVRLIIHCCVCCNLNKSLCLYLLVIIFRALNDPKSRELKGKNGEESATCGWYCVRVSPSATWRNNLSRDHCALGVPVQQNTISFHIHFREIVLEYVLEIHMDKRKICLGVHLPPYKYYFNIISSFVRLFSKRVVLYTDRIGLTSDGLFSDLDRIERKNIGYVGYTIFVRFFPFRLNPIWSEINLPFIFRYPKSDGLIRSVYSTNLRSFVYVIYGYLKDYLFTF